MVITNADFDVTSLDKGKFKHSWSGWNIERFSYNAGAWASPKGVFRNGKYGYVETIEPDAQGNWNL